MRTGCSTSFTRSFPDDDLVLEGADSEDRGLGWVDDGREVIDAVHPEIADRECTTRHFVRYGLYARWTPEIMRLRAR